MKTVLTMAGEGKRFSKLFPGIPKYKITYNGKAFFEMTLKTIEAFRENELIIIVQKGACDTEFIRETCAAEGYNNFRIITTNMNTDGQASTLMLASDAFLSNRNEDFIVYNIDTFFSPKITLEIPADAKGYIPVIKSDQRNLSFVKIDENNIVIDVKEKIKISDYGSIGLYYFSSWVEFQTLYKDHRHEVMSKYNETYIAPFYTYLIDTGKVFAQILPSNEVHFIGSEEEYESYQRMKVDIFHD